MKINVAFPATGCQKLFEIHDELKVKIVLTFILNNPKRNSNF